jgi:hypothetical protein
MASTDSGSHAGDGNELVGRRRHSRATVRTGFQPPPVARSRRHPSKKERKKPAGHAGSRFATRNRAGRTRTCNPRFWRSERRSVSARTQAPQFSPGQLRSARSAQTGKDRGKSMRAIYWFTKQERSRTTRRAPEKIRCARKRSGCSSRRSRGELRGAPAAPRASRAPEPARHPCRGARTTDRALAAASAARACGRAPL